MEGPNAVNHRQGKRSSTVVWMLWLSLGYISPILPEGGSDVSVLVIHFCLLASRPSGQEYVVAMAVTVVSLHN